MPATVSHGDSWLNATTAHWMKPSGVIACGKSGRAFSLLTGVFHQSESKCDECFKQYREWLRNQTESGKEPSNASHN